MEDILQGLNDAQREAVTSTEGFIRVIAGAGSGKTRALSRRFAYLVNEVEFFREIFYASRLPTSRPTKCASEFTHSQGTTIRGLSQRSTVSACLFCRRTAMRCSIPKAFWCWIIPI